MCQEMRARVIAICVGSVGKHEVRRFDGRKLTDLLGFGDVENSSTETAEWEVKAAAFGGHERVLIFESSSQSRWRIIKEKILDLARQ